MCMHTVYVYMGIWVCAHKYAGMHIHVCTNKLKPGVNVRYRLPAFSTLFLRPLNLELTDSTSPVGKKLQDSTYLRVRARAHTH